MDLFEFVIPAIDIKEGRVVRLYRGAFDRAVVYSNSPSETARIFESAGFRKIHVVDLDGAQGGYPCNLEHIRAIRRSFEGIVQVGGGVRSYEIARMLFEEGIDLVVVGTLALKNPEEFDRILVDYPDRVILSMGLSLHHSGKGW